jgi:hypothetical protein
MPARIVAALDQVNQVRILEGNSKSDGTLSRVALWLFATLLFRVRRVVLHVEL